jgi:hypothetical protein
MPGVHCFAFCSDELAFLPAHAQHFARMCTPACVDSHGVIDAMKVVENAASPRAAFHVTYFGTSVISTAVRHYMRAVLKPPTRLSTVDG